MDQASLGDGGMDGGIALGSTSQALSTPSSCGNTAGLANAPWPMRSGCPTHVKNAEIGPLTSNIRWSFDTFADARASAVIAADGHLVMGGDGGIVRKINASTGSVLGQLTVGGAIKSSPAILSDSTVIVSSESGKLSAINYGAFTLKWTFPATGSLGALTGSPAVLPDASIAIGSADKSVYLVGANGQQRWKYTTTGAVISSPAVSADGSLLYIGSADTYLYALNTSNGTLKWRTKLAAKVDASPAVSKGRVFIAAADKAYALDALTGAILWQRSLGSGTVYSPAVSESGPVLFGVKFTFSGGSMMALSPSDGTQLWRFDTLGGVETTAIIDKFGSSYFGDNAGTMNAVDAAGQVIFKHTLPNGLLAGIKSSAVISSTGGLIFGGDDNWIYSMGTGRTAVPNGGTCSADLDCEPGLLCGVGNGTRFGKPAGTNACWVPSCENKVKDPLETEVDCGGPCGSCTNICSQACTLDTQVTPPALEVLSFAQGAFTRGSIGTYQTGANTLAVARGDQLRYEDRGDGNGRVALFEGPRTNRVVWSEAMGTSPAWWTGVAQTPTMTLTEDAAVSPAGTMTAERWLAQTGGNAARAQTIINAMPAGSLSTWLRLTNPASFNPASPLKTRTVLTDLTGGWYNQVLDWSLPAAWERRSMVTTPATKSTAVQMSHKGAWPGNATQFPALPAADFVVWGWQLEEGKFPSSYIPTQESALTRKVDRLVFTASDVPPWVRTGIWQIDVLPLYSSNEIAITDEFVLMAWEGGHISLGKDATGGIIKVVRGTTVVKRTIGWARNTKLTLTVNATARTLQILGASTGDGTLSYGTTAVGTGRVSLGALLDGTKSAFARVSEIRKVASASLQCTPDANFCTEACPCPEGEGGCDSNSECVSGLVCLANAGARFGYPSNFGICAAPKCKSPAPSECGTTQSQCGTCPTAIVCASNADCSAGFECAEDGWRFGVIGKVCRPEGCGNPDTQRASCGNYRSICGLCDAPSGQSPQCVPNCAAGCGDNGCNGSCGACPAGIVPLSLTPAFWPLGEETPLLEDAPTAKLGPTEYDVDVNANGKPTFRMELVTPPGRGKVEPHLSLRYGSGGDGYLGRDWSLDGLSRIERCAHLREGETLKGIYNTTGFCLDGRRLVEGESGPGGIEYIVEDSSAIAYFITTDRSRGPYWKVTTQDGRMLTLTKVASAWMVTREEDLNGNYLTVTWQSKVTATEYETALTEYYPDRIDYTGNSVTGLKTSRRISFLYHDDPDASPGGTVLEGDEPRSLNGSTPIADPRRLGIRKKRISQVWAQVYMEPLKRYVFAYEKSPASGLTRMKSVQECAGPADVCKAPIVFSYSGASPRTNTGTVKYARGYIGSSWHPAEFGDSTNFISGNFDGKPGEELAYQRRDSRGRWTLRFMVDLGTNPREIDTGIVHRPGSFFSTAYDWNQDGADDLLTTTDGLNNTSDGAHPDLIAVSYNFASGTRSTHDIRSRFPANSIYWRMTDLNGDGRPDLFYCGGLGTGVGAIPGTWRFQYTVNGADRAQFSQEHDSGFGCMTPGDPTSPRVDLANRAFRWLVGGVGLNTQIPNNYVPTFVDVDGDGVVEWLWRGRDMGGNKRPNGLYRLAGPDVGTLDWIAPDPDFSPGHCRTTPCDDLDFKADPKRSTAMPIDINGDGRPELITLEVGAVDPLYPDQWDYDYTGNAKIFFNYGAKWAPTGESIKGVSLPGLAGAIVLDFNEDGRDDLLLVRRDETINKEGWFLLTSNGKGFDDQGLLYSYSKTIVANHNVMDDNSVPDAVARIVRPIFPLDIDGDGRLDLVRETGGAATDVSFNVKNVIGQLIRMPQPTAPIFHVEQLKGQPADLLLAASQKIQSNTTITKRITWSSLAAPDVYVRATSNPHWKSHAPVSTTTWVAKKLETQVNDVEVGHLTEYFEYSRGWTHLFGRGFEGFELREITRPLATAWGEVEYERYEPWRHSSDTFHTGIPVEQGVLTTERHSRTKNEIQNDITYLRGATSGKSRPISHAYVKRGVRTEGTPFAVETVTETNRVMNWNRELSTRVKTWREGVPTFDALLEVITDYGPRLAPTGFGRMTVLNKPAFRIVRDCVPDPTQLACILTDVCDKTGACQSVCIPSDCATQRSEYDYYPRAGLDTRTVKTFAGTRETQRTTFGWSAEGNLVSVSATADPGQEGEETRTKTTFYEDPDRIFATTLVNAANHVIQQAFHPLHGRIVASSDANGIVTLASYDAFGRKGREVSEEGGTDRVYTWSAGERHPKLTVTAKGDETVVKHFDALGRLTQIDRTALDGKVVAQEQSYDAHGRLGAVSLPRAVGEASRWTRYEYDTAGRHVKTTTPDQHVTTLTYGVLSVDVKDPLNHVRTAYEDGLGRVTLTVDPVDEQGVRAETRYKYAPFGHVKQVSNHGGEVIAAITRDPYGCPTRRYNADTGTITTTCNGFGEAEREQHLESGDVRITEHDVLGRVTVRTDTQAPNGVHTGRTSISTSVWDTSPHGLGRLAEEHLKTVDSAGTRVGAATSFYYDDLSRWKRTDTVILGKVYSEEVTERDSHGRVKRVRQPQGPNNRSLEFVYGYDDFGHQRELQYKTATGTYDLWRQVAVTDQGLPEDELLGNGIATKRAYFADSLDVKSLTTTLTSGEFKQGYEWNPDGTLKERYKIHGGSKRETFGYDGLGRLIHSEVRNNPTSPVLSTRSFAYDTDGNIVFKSDVGSYAYAGSRPHAVTSAGSSRPLGFFEYDSHGNQIKRGDMRLEYSPAGLPTRIWNPSGAEERYEYDARGSEVWHQNSRETVVSTGSGYRHRTDASGNVTHEYVAHAGGRAVAVLEWSSDADQVDDIFYQHDDLLGSTTAITDATGALVEERSYDAFGTPRSANWVDKVTLPSGTLGFTGHRHADVLGQNLVMAGARVLDPALGQFLQADPWVDLANSQDLNLYSYARNTPLTLVDPTGAIEQKAQDKDYDFGAVARIQKPTYYGGGAKPPPPEVPRHRAPRPATKQRPSSTTFDRPGQSPDATPKDAFDGGGQAEDRGSDASNEAEGDALQDAEGVEGDGEILDFSDTIMEVGGVVLEGVAEAVIPGLALAKDIDTVVNSDSNVERTIAVVGIIMVIAPVPKLGPVLRTVERVKKVVSRGGKGAKKAAQGLCFTPGTLVLMADGSTKAIEDVEEGEYVVAEDPDDPRSFGPYRVEGTIKNFAERILRIHLGDGEAVIEATGEHPFWTESRGWLLAEDLEEGDLLRKYDGSFVQVARVAIELRETPTYNLSIERVHTYFVLGGDSPVLVHNQKVPLDTPGYWNYVLRDGGGNVYYSGMAGPNQSVSDVRGRHKAKGRFGAGDQIDPVRGSRTYGEARVLEHENALKYNTYSGKTPQYRGNRQNPIGPKNSAPYYPKGGYTPCN